MMTKKEYCEYVGQCLNDDEIKELFDCTREQLESDDYWNINLEYQYNVMYAEEEYEAEYGDIYDDDDDDGYDSNCYCDTYGHCGGTSCPQFFQCHQ